MVEVANNGAEAVAMVAKQTYDGVLMDCQMPVMDGFEATRKIREDVRFAHLPILAMTANAMAGDREKCVEVGMNDHIAKPIDVSQLFLTLSHWVKVSSPAPAASDAASAPAAAVPPGKPAKGDLPPIAGLDLSGALDRVGGSTKLLKKLIVRFDETQAQVMDRIKAAMDASDTNTAVREAHTVKGLAGNIGATAMAKTAAVVEGMLNRGESDGLAAALTVMEAELAALLTAISTALGTATPAKVAAATPQATVSDALANDLRRLAKLLADCDSEASDLAESLEEPLAEAGAAAQIRALLKPLGEFDFDAAAHGPRGTLVGVGRRGLRLDGNLAFSAAAGSLGRRIGPADAQGGPGCRGGAHPVRSDRRRTSARPCRSAGFPQRWPGRTAVPNRHGCLAVFTAPGPPVPTGGSAGFSGCCSSCTTVTPSWRVNLGRPGSSASFSWLPTGRTRFPCPVPTSATCPLPSSRLPPAYRASGTAALFPKPG